MKVWGRTNEPSGPRSSVGGVRGGREELDLFGEKVSQPIS